MSVILKDWQDRSLQVNAWNWGVLHFAVECAQPPVFDDEQFMATLRFGGATLSQAQVDRLFVYLVKIVLPKLEPGQRMRPDFSVTDAPDDGKMYYDDQTKNYSLHYEVLIEVLRFLQQAQPPVSVL